MKYRKLGELSKIKTGKLDANASAKNGEFSFFTCGRETLAIDSYSIDSRLPSLHYINFVISK